MRSGIRVATAVGIASLGLLRAEAAMDVTAPWVAGGKGIERGVAQIRCDTEVANVVKLSRGAVLDLGHDAKSDIVLATAHGLPETKEDVLSSCRVLGAHAYPYRIAGVWRSAQAGEGVAGDWAVLLLRGRIEGDVGRLPVARVSGDTWAELAGGEASLRVLLRQADPHEGDCHLRQLAVPYEYLPTELLMYFCGPTTRAAGLSGSPLLIGVEGRPFVVGVHVGWGLQTLGDAQLHAVSLGRPIDGEIAAAIAAAAEAARR